MTTLMPEQIDREKLEAGLRRAAGQCRASLIDTAEAEDGDWCAAMPPETRESLQADAELFEQAADALRQLQKERDEALSRLSDLEASGREVGNGSAAPSSVCASVSAESTELHCQDCDQDYTIWYADNDLWNAVMRGPASGYAQGAPEPFLCARCFLIRAEDVTQFARVTWPEEPSRRDRERAEAQPPWRTEYLTASKDASNFAGALNEVVRILSDKNSPELSRIYAAHEVAVIALAEGPVAEGGGA